MNSDGSNSDGNNYDLTTMIKDKKTLLISDFEGTTPTAHFNKFKEYCSGDDNKQVLFLGDVFDNTAQFSENCNGTSCENPDEISDCPTDENYCALQTIKLLVDNEKSCKYVFGNRDINKIKLLPFFSFKSKSKSNWWTNGKSYDEIVNNFFRTVENPETRWLIQPDNYKYFQPFWNKKKYADTKSNWGDTGEKNYINTEINDIYDRFVMMFGADPKHGTMSALVTLKCIPNELLNGIDGGIEDFYLKITSIDESVDDAIKKKRIRAALTITIFMRMLDKELWTGIKKETPHTAFGGLDGYLYHYLTKAPAAYYAEAGDKNLLLFAHGGITNNFINASGNLDIDDIRTRSMDRIVGVGGDGHGNIIKTKIINYNNVYFTTLNNFFNKRGENSVGDISVGGGDYPVLNRLGENPKFNDPNINDELEKTQLKNMLVLLSISAGIKENPNQKKEPSDNDLDEYDKKDNKYDKEDNKYTKIYNIFGHASSSAGYSLSKVQGSEKTYYINTDFSTTLYKEGILCDKNYNSNYLIAVLNTIDDKFEITV